MKPIPKDCIFSWSNSTDAEKYIGMDGYFGNSLDELKENISYKSPKVLSEIHLGACVNDVFVDTDRIYYGLFLPSILLGEDDE